MSICGDEWIGVIVFVVYRGLCDEVEMARTSSVEFKASRVVVVGLRIVGCWVVGGTVGEVVELEGLQH